MALTVEGNLPLSHCHLRSSIRNMKHLASPLIILVFAVTLLAACSKDELSPSESAKADYERGQELINNQNYGTANLFLEKFASKHPYSQHIAQAELLRIYAAYKSGEYILSETLATRFISRHPRYPNLSYAQYMLGMSHVKQAVESQRNPLPTQRAIQAFNKLLKLYPKSEYAPEAAVHLQNMRNKLAEHELFVGKFYFERERFVAASNRFQTILKDYQTSPAIEEALYYLSASYSALKLTESARDTAVLLRHNYPKSDWSEKAAAFL